MYAQDVDVEYNFRQSGTMEATAVLPIDGCTNWAEVVGSNPDASYCTDCLFTLIFDQKQTSVI